MRSGCRFLARSYSQSVCVVLLAAPWESGTRLMSSLGVPFGFAGVGVVFSMDGLFGCFEADLVG